MIANATPIYQMKWEYIKKYTLSDFHVKQIRIIQLKLAL